MEQQYLEALRCSEGDYNFVKHYLHALTTQDGEFQADYDKLCDLLVRRPYPMLQLFKLTEGQAKFHTAIDRAVVRALQILLPQCEEEFTPQFINFLCNFPLNALRATTMWLKLSQTLAKFGLTDQVYMALLSRTETKLADDVLVYLKRQWQRCDGLPSKELVLLQALEKKLHFVPLTSMTIKNFQAIEDVALRNNFLILKMANEFSQPTQTLDAVGNVSKWLQDFSVDKIPTDLEEVHKFFYADFQRICAILEFLRKYPDKYKQVKVEALLNFGGLIKLLYEYEINSSFSETHRTIQNIYKFHQHIPAAAAARDVELETFTYHAALSTTLEIILDEPPFDSEKYYTTQVQHLALIFRQIRKMDLVCALIEDVFRLLFLRWENLNTSTGNLQAKMSSSKGKANKSSSPKSTDDDSAADSISVRTAPGAFPSRHGFICRGPALNVICSFLKGFVTKKLHSEEFREASKGTQVRFQRNLDFISEALWKYSVLKKIDDSSIHSGPQQQMALSVDELLQLVQMHVWPIEKSSSDDESRDRHHFTSFSRRKAPKKKNRRRSTFSGATLSRTVAPPHVNLMVSSGSAMPNGVEDPVAQIKAHKMLTSFIDRSIIPKMLGSPENLAIMALGLKNFDDVQYIIEAFNLQNTELNHELAYVKEQQQVKQKLETIYKNYRAQEDINCNSSQEPRATIDQIRTVAAKGFEVSKIIGVIDNFAQTQKIMQTEAVKQALLKYANNAKYTFLRQFDERHLKVVIIADLILNLRLNRDIVSNILRLIKRQHGSAGGIAPSSKEDRTLKSQLPRDIGPLPLLENLLECMRLLDNKSLRELLCDNYYALKPRKLGLELQREQVFQKLFYMPPDAVGRCDQLRMYGILFQNLESKNNYYSRFTYYVTHLAKLVHLRDANLEYHTSELLKLDLCTIIGELIFDCNMAPPEIEANVAALNLNLVHMIALNICPEISERPRSCAQAASPQKLQTVLDFIAQQNSLLAYLLQNISSAEMATDVPHINGKYLDNFLQLNEIALLAKLYGDKKLIAVLRSDNVSLKLVKQLDSKLEQLNVLRFKMGTSESQAPINQEVEKLTIELITDDPQHIELAACISNIDLRAKVLKQHFTKIATTRLARDLIESTLQHKAASTEITPELHAELRGILDDIMVYAKVAEVMLFETWAHAYDYGLKSPNLIFEKLLQLHLYKLCYRWCKVVKLAERFAQYKKLCLKALLDALLELTDEDGAELNTYEYMLQILETFPVEECATFLDAHKDKFRSLVLLNYALDFLAKNNTSEDYQNYSMSVVILERLTPQDREQFWGLLKYPLLILEVLIMNARFEVLGKVLEGVRLKLQRDHVPYSERSQPCGFCFDKRGNDYDLHTSKSKNSPHKRHFQLGAETGNAHNSAFILLNFNLYQKNHFVTNECIDLLLRIYATKALDYQISDTSSSLDRMSQSTDMQQSLDSLCGAFVMPKRAPTQNEWVRDEEATHCMCCRRAAFTMLMRRHHCRRCGRVVCFACSAHRMRIPELYDEVEVRICHDCHRVTEETQSKASKDAENGEQRTVRSHGHESDLYKWKLSGNITHDKLLREEFCYEHAPSVALCLSILSYHLGREKCIELLLFHCIKLEKLIVPNPEVDYELVAKMMNCLALAAKVRGGPAEVENIREHSEIIISVVQNGCDALIPPGPLSNHSIRKLADSLVKAEKWQLALEVHLKYGFSTAGVMAAHGLSCLRAGCFNTAREKFTHCMPKLSNESGNAKIYASLLGSAESNDNAHEISKITDIPLIKRPQRGPPLLQEILKLIELMSAEKPQPETLRRVSVIRNSNTSLASIFSRRKDPFNVPLNEPALNILNTLENIKQISKGHYGNIPNQKAQFRNSRSFEECLHYLLTYGSHTDILQFLMRHRETVPVLRYLMVQQLEPDYFIHNVYLVMLRNGQVPQLIAMMLEFEKGLTLWRNVLLQTCRYLESQNLLNSLYQLQMLLNDPVRASMTCVKFYSMNCENFQQLHGNAHHLHNAHKHLQSELEATQWENINPEPVSSGANRRKSTASSRRSSTVSNARAGGGTFYMQMDARSLNGHISTLLKQLEVAKFLAKCEKENSAQIASQKENSAENELITEKYLNQIRIDGGKGALPTLFDSTQDKILICILILLCGKNIDEGFGLAYRIIQDYKLQPFKVFAATAKYLARNQRLPEVEKLLNCITSNNGTSTRDIDEILSIAVNSATNSNEPDVKAALDSLAKKISNVELRISCHIFIGQLKSAYLLANKYERTADIRRILRQAELTNQIHIKKLCEKKLNINLPPTDKL